QVARALETQYASRLEEHAAEMAEHFAQSTDPEGLTKAIHYSEMAARRALAVYAYTEAARLLEQAVEVQEILAPEDRAARCDLLLLLGAALAPTGDTARIFTVVAEQAFQLAEALGDSHSASSACQLAIEAMHRAGFAATVTSPAYHRWAERADRHAAPESRARVIADLALSSICNSQQDHGEERRLTARALAVARR